MLSSTACAKLGAATFLRIPRTHILFSLASCTITIVKTTTGDNQPYTLATLDAFSSKILTYLQLHLDHVAASVKQLQQVGKGGCTESLQLGEMDADDSDEAVE